MTNIVPGQKYEYKDKNEKHFIEVMNYIDNVVYKHYTIDDAGRLVYGKPEEISHHFFKGFIENGHFKRVGEDE